jgi:hypothetical protein
MDFSRAWERASEIEGWLSEDQARVLFDAARLVEPGGTIVEIGSHHGKSTVILAAGKREGVRLLAVDPWDDTRWGGGAAAYDIFNTHTAGLDVQCFRGASIEAARQFRGDVDLLYIDGAHDRATVLTDLDGWNVCGDTFVHDAFSAKGVTLALLQRRALTRSWRYIGSVRSLAHFRREHLPLATAAVNTLRVTARLGYFTRNVAIKILLHQGRSTRWLGWTESCCPY